MSDVYAGFRWQEGGFAEGWVEVEARRVVAAGLGPPPSAPRARGVLLPTPVNAHTHVADFVARGKVPADATLAELVAPPDGWKHRVLRATPPRALETGMRRALAEARAAGTRVLFDFREGAALGARLLRDAARAEGVEAVVLGRPAPGADPAAVLAEGDGLGLSALRDVPPAEARRQAEAARAAGKRFALHWSEGEREDLDAALELAPDFLVHAVAAEAADLVRLAEAQVPLVACPRSNARLLGRVPDVRAWLDLGVVACLGTDNAMLQTVSVLDELRAARELLPTVRPAELLAMAVDAPRRALGVPGAAPRPWEPGAPADFVVLAAAGDPWAAVFGEARVVAEPWRA